MPSDSRFEEFMLEAIDKISPAYKERLQNVAFIVEDEPTPKQRQMLALGQNQTLFGLYEGVPLTARQGAPKLLPDKITLFKQPLLNSSANKTELKDNIRHTIWHEVAHYFGLNHDRITELDHNN